MISVAVVAALVGLASGQSKDPFGGKEKPKTTSSSNSSTGTSSTSGGSGSVAQPAKSGLEKALDEALKHNPDLRVAAAKASEAEAVLTRARLQVTHKVVAAYQAVELAKATVKVATDQLERLKDLAKKIDRAELREQITTTEQELAAAKSKLATAEADLNYLLGKPAKKLFKNTTGLERFGRHGGGAVADFDNDGSLDLYYALDGARRRRLTTFAGGEKSAAADKVRKALDRRISLKLSETPARDALKMIIKESGGIHIQASTKGDAIWDEKITADLKDVPLGAVLQLLEDTIGYRIAVRSYGLLIATEGSIPRGAVMLADFWPGGKSETKPTTTPPKK
jgi:hypothetical protein